MDIFKEEKSALALNECSDEIATENKASQPENPLPAHHHSDGSELIPAEAQTGHGHDTSELLDRPLAPGYSIDDEGLLNSYTIEPQMYVAEEPKPELQSPEQQSRYFLQGAIAAVVIVLAGVLAFYVS